MANEPIPADLFEVEPPIAVMADEDVDHDYLAEDIHERWKIEDDGAAEWAMRKLAQYEADDSDATARAAEWQEQIDQWLDRQLRRNDARASFFRTALMNYALRERAASNDQRKTIDLPSGQVKTRMSKGKLQVLNDDAVIVWAKATKHENVIRVKESVDIAKLRALDLPDGHAHIPGTAMSQDEITASVEVTR